MKKQNLKKPSKKAAVKLIDGQYKIKQLIRLKPKEAEILEKYQKVFDEKTINGTIERLLSNFDQVYMRNEDRGKELNTLYQKVRSHESLTSQLRSGLKLLLQDPVETKGKSDNCKECGEPLDEDRECRNYKCDLQFETQ